MSMEDEKWRENFAESEADRNREGYKPYNRENYKSYNQDGNRQHRPRVQRSERAYSADGSRGERVYRPYNRDNNASGEKSYRSYGQRPGFNRDNRQGGYRPNNNYQRDNGGFNRDENYNREGGYNRGGNYNRNAGTYNRNGGYNRDGGYGHNNNNGGYRKQGGYGYNNKPSFGGQRPVRRRTPDYDPNAKYNLKKQIEYKEVNVDPDAPIRLNKFLANAGVCSRREADEFITAGVVSVNGEVVTELGTKVKRSDEVKFHDQPVNIERKVYVLLNKPKDYVTTSDDPQNRKTVMDLVKDACPERIYPVGRLDRNTTGVLLFTNDGDLASKLTHPKFLKKKIYHVYTDKNVTAADLRRIAEGITLDDGEIRADAVDYASPTDKKQVGIEIHSGKNRIVRRIFEALGYRVVKLDRVLFAGLTKKNLRRGDWRFLTEQEVNMLRMGAF